MAEPLPSCSAVDMAVESTPPLKKRLLSPTGSTSCPPTRSNSSLEDSETSSVPKVGWPNLLPGGFDAGSDLDLDKHLSPAVYSRSSTQTSLKSPPPPPPNPSIKRRLQLSLSPKHCADDPSSRPATAVPTAAKSSTPGPPPLVATRLKLAPPPPRPEGATPEPTPPAKAITPVLHKPAQPTPAAMPKPAQPTPPPAKAIAPVLPKPPQPTPPPQPEDHLSPATLEKHSPPAPAPESAPEEHRSPAGQSEQHPPKEKRVSWAEPSVPPEAAHEPPAEVRSQAVAPAAEVTPATPPSSAEAAEPKASAHCAKVPSQAVPEAPAATPAESDAKQGATNTAQAEQSPHAGTSDTAETQTPPHNGKMEHQKHEKHSPTKKEPTSSPDVNVKKTPASVLKAPPTAPATLKAQPSRPPKAASKAAPAVTGQASASKAAPAVTGQASKAAPAVPGQAAASKAAPAETGQALAPSSSLPQPLARPAALDVAHVSVDAQAATPIVPGSYNERQALQGEFKRRIKEPEANAIPQEIVDLWTDLVKNNRKAGKTALFEKWLHAGKDWSLLIIENSKSHTDRTVGRKKMGWRTRAQIIALHVGDTHAADEIIAEKTSEGLVDHHPDSHQLKTYYVCTELGRKEEEETESKITMKTQAKMNCGGEAAQKLMGGLTGDQVDGFFKLRTFQKPSQASQEVAQGSPTTVLPQPNKKPGTRRAAPKEMPADPIEGLQWIVPKLLKDLTEAKMWPIKMVQVKHQETLRDTLLAQSKGLETTFFEMKHYLDQYKEENGFDPSEDEEFLEKLTNAVAIRDAYAETAGMASKLCKPKGGRRSANKAADEE